jgi:hypothetical protein
MKPIADPDTIKKMEWLKARLRKYPHRYDQSEICGMQACLYGFCLPRMSGSKAVTANASAGLAGLDEWAGWLGVSCSKASRLLPSEWTGEAYKFNRNPDDTPQRASEKACQRIDLWLQSGGAI